MYLFLVLILLLCWYLYPKVNKVSKTVLFIFWVVITSLVMCLRDVSVGIDTANYYESFLTIKKYPLSKLLLQQELTELEPGYVILMKLCCYISTNFYFSQIITSFLFCFISLYGIRRLSPNPFFSFVIFLPLIYFNGFNIYRQIMASAFFFLSWSFLLDKKYITTILFFLLALSFHTTSLLFLICYFCYAFRNNNFIIKLAPLGLILLLSSYAIIVEFVLSKSGLYGVYMDNHLMIRAAGGNLIFLWGLIIIIAAFVFYSHKFNPNEHLFGLFSLIYVVCLLIGQNFNYFDRVGIPFSFFVTIIFPIFTKLLKNKFVKIGYVSISSLIFIYLFIVKGSSPDFAYKFLF